MDLQMEIPIWFRMVLTENNMVMPARLCLERLLPEKAYRYTTINGAYRFDMCMYQYEADVFRRYLQRAGIETDLVAMDDWRDWS